MDKRYYLLPLLTLLFINFTSPPLHAQDSEPWAFQILESDAQHLLIELTLPTFTQEIRTQNGIEYHQLMVSDRWGRWGEPGQPQIPRYTIPIGMPGPGTPQVSVLEAENEHLTGYHLYPNPDYIAGGTAEAIEAVEVFALDAEAYGTDTAYPGPLTEVAGLGFLREQPLFQLHLYPFQYNPAQKTLTVTRRLKVLITFPEVALDTLSVSSTPAVPGFQKALERSLVNYDALPQSARPLASDEAKPDVTTQNINNTNGDYVIITHPNFYNGIQALASYRASQGRTVVVKKSDDIYNDYSNGVKSADAIRDFLADAYANWQIKPLYVLLVGDADADAVLTDPNNPNQMIGYDPTVADDYLPAHYENTLVFGLAPIDAWYAKVTPDGQGGYDDHPDLYVGRIPARVANDVNTVFEKIQGYEQSPVAGSWARKAILVADDDDADNNGVSDFAHDLDTINNLLPADITSKQMYGHIPGTTVPNEVSQGSLILAYSGHGWSGGWGGWTGGGNIFQGHQVLTLTNGNQMPFMTVANCSNGYFAHPDRNQVMAEAFLLVEDKGGIASWAPAALSFPTINSLMNEALYRAIFVDEQVVLGEAVTSARLVGLENPQFDLNLFEMFTFFGDPATRLDVPPTLTLGGQVSADPVVVGNEITYTLTYQISGANSTRDLVLVNTLPGKVTFQSASVSPSSTSGQTQTWNLGTVAEGTYQITITGLLDTLGLLNDDTLSNQARLYDSTGGDKNIQIDTTVLTNDLPPTANFISSFPDLLGQITEFASISEGTNLTYQWNFGDGSPVVTTASTTIDHIYPAEGNYTVTLTASNSVGSDSTSGNVQIIPNIISPIASFISSGPDPLGNATSFTNTSQDGGDSNATYLWDFGDGASSTAQNPIHIYKAVGSYTVRLTITNSALTNSSDTFVGTVEITVAPQSNANKIIYLPVVTK